MNVLKFDPNHNKRNSHQAEGSKSPATSSHLDVAINNKFILDIKNILISPENAMFHLSLKAEIRGHNHAIWLNEFSDDKEYVGDKALEAIASAMEHGFPQSPEVLKSWYQETIDYIESEMNILVL